MNTNLKFINRAQTGKKELFNSQSVLRCKRTLQCERPAPKRHGRDVFHAWMLDGAEFAGKLDMPILSKVKSMPSKLISFSDAMNKKTTNFKQVVHFFEDDFRIERFWHNPTAYLDRLKKFDGVIGLDFSVCWDFPVALKDYNYFRNNVCTFWLQQHLPVVIPQARCELSNYKDVLAGHPKHSTIAIGARSMVKEKEDRLMLKKSVRYIIDYLEPLNLLWYGSAMYGVADYAIEKNIPIKFFQSKGRGDLCSTPNKEVYNGWAS